MPDEPMIRFHIVNLDKIADKLKLLPAAIIDAGLEQANYYLLNVLIRKEIPPQRYITRRQAYGQTFQSDKQRRWFFWALNSGAIDVPYHRRGPGGGVQSHWEIEGKGRTAYIVNRDPSAKWVYSEDQARLNQLVGWLRVSQIIDKYTKNIIASFVRGAKSAIRKLGLA